MAKQRKFTPEYKAQVVLEILTGAKSAAQACREYQLSDSTISRWKIEFIEHAAEVFRRDKGNEDYEARIAELERMIGQQTIELAAAKKASSFWNSIQNRSGS
jgi:transposase-like protein